MKKNKIIKISLIVALSLLIIFLTTFLILALSKNKYNFSLFNTKTELIKDEKFNVVEIKDINILSSSNDIKINKTTNDTVNIKVYGVKEDDVSVEFVDGILSLKYVNDVPCIGFCFQEKYIEVFVPENYTNDLNVKSKGGNIFVDSLSVGNMVVESSSGDIKIKDNNKVKAIASSGNIKVDTVNELDIYTSSGDIEIGRVNNYLTAETNSGDVVADSLVLVRESKIVTTSGDIIIDSINDLYVDASTRNGEINVRNNNRMSPLVLKLVTRSGNIDVN